MFCASCGKNNPDDAKFCEGCGTTLNGSGSSQSAPPSQNTYSQSPPPPSYQAAPAQSSYSSSAGQDAPLTVGQYIGTLLLGSLCFILWFVWAFGSDVNINKKNLAKAYLLLALIAFGASILFTALMLALGVGLGSAAGGW